MSAIKDLKKAVARAEEDASSALGRVEDVREIVDRLVAGDALKSDSAQTAAERLCAAVERFVGFASCDESIEMHDLRNAAQDFRDACRPTRIVTKSEVARGAA